MADEAEKMKGFDLNQVLIWCQAFIGGQWVTCSVDQITFTVLSQGFGNRLFIIRRPGHEANPIDEGDPHTILLRLYGGNILPVDAPIRTMDKTGEVIVSYTMGRMGLGPKLYGSFLEGRIEQFYPDVHTAELPEWCESMALNKKVTHSLAHFHLLNFPTSKRPWDIKKIGHDCDDLYKKKHVPRLSSLLSEVDIKNCKILKFPVEQEIEWIEQMIPKVNSRVIFAHNDTNRSNVLIRKDDDGEDTIMLIDYEFAGMNYRSCELGNFFGMKVFDFGQKDMITGRPYPSVAERRELIKEYLSHQTSIAMDVVKGDVPFKDWDANGRDSVDHVLMESDFGSAVTRFIDVVWSLRDMDQWIDMMEKESDPNKRFSPVMNAFVDFYYERKSYFIQTHDLK